MSVIVCISVWFAIILCYILHTVAHPGSVPM